MLGCAGVIGSYPVFIERNIVLVNKYKIPVPSLPPAFENFTIVQLTDLHYGLLVSKNHIESIIKNVNTISRDMVICTGDYIHERNGENQIDEIWPLLGRLKAPFGVLSVLGNHDHWGDTERSIYWMNRTGQNFRHVIRRYERNGQSLWFVGAGDYWEDHVSIDKLMEPIPKEDCRIILAHNPDSSDTIYGSNVNLIISGHTHGGQVNIPFYGTPVLPVKNKNYSFGLKKSKRNFNVFISRGIGWAIYPVRFNCYPEIAVLKLVREEVAA
jgi:predicted MPP superfamily phosphohydrolase